VYIDKTASPSDTPGTIHADQQGSPTSRLACNRLDSMDAESGTVDEPGKRTALGSGHRKTVESWIAPTGQRRAHAALDQHLLQLAYGGKESDGGSCDD